MSNRYETGAAHEVLARMARYAIRDQRGLIDAHEPYVGELDDETKHMIEQCNANIRDFQRISKGTRGNSVMGEVPSAQTFRR